VPVGKCLAETLFLAGRKTALAGAWPARAASALAPFRPSDWAAPENLAFTALGLRTRVTPTREAGGPACRPAAAMFAVAFGFTALRFVVFRWASAKGITQTASKRST
jgi:hypothetical protein